jgi:excinuclease ABC subunit A
VLSLLAKTGTSHHRSALAYFLDQQTCMSCHGARLSPLARNVKVQELSLPEFCALSIRSAMEFMETCAGKRMDETTAQIIRRLRFLCEIGLDYLSLNRAAPTLSGGETQRIALARQLGSGLTGCLYVLDEPTIGLHPHNNYLLNQALKNLCDLGNTLVIVEHDPLTINTADYLIDFGPGAGRGGGQITAEGTLKQIKKNPNSLTGKYLSGKRQVDLPAKRKKSEKTILIQNALLHNLKGFDLNIPKGIFTCITGVSGSGKSTLMHDILKPALKRALAGKKREEKIQYLHSHISGYANLEKVIDFDQSPIGQTIRADVSTYIDLLTPLRYFYASLPEAKTRGLQPKHFSYNHRKGMCNKCFGLGYRIVDLQFLPSVNMTCDSCQGDRLNQLSLAVHYRGKNLGQLLRLTVAEAIPFLPEHPKIKRLLENLSKVGLSYLQLGQALNSLSGGEAQRLRLARELAKRSRGKICYLFDEPTIGLHSEDIQMLLPIFHGLVQKGHTLIMIEHNLDVIKNAGYIIDLGPGAGPSGGEVIAVGTPEEIAQNKQSSTGKYLQAVLPS